ncbi:MAG: hypothetical protein H0X47_05960 [Nitrospirales bacterium]|nr:hypothetical protein [Nitrospirales bacterium]
MTTSEILTHSPPTQEEVDIHDLTIGQRIDWLVGYSRRHSQEFQSPESWLARSRYLAQHPTAITAFMCMDGRINIPVATNTPRGIIFPFRNLGGRFNLGWPHLGEVMTEHVQNMVKQGRRTLALITYHYSKGNAHRGCAGFNYDTVAARTYSQGIKQQMEAVFGTGHDTVYPIVCGFETDEDALVFHGQNRKTLDLSSVSIRDQDCLPALLEELYPDMPQQIQHDLLPLVRDNITHVADIKRTNRTFNIEHREWIICVGRGFDWLHTSNLALIIGPYSPDLADPIRKAAGIIEVNMQSGRIPADGFLLLAKAPYHEIGVDRACAELKSAFLSEFAAEVIRTEFPKLAEKMHVRTAVLAWQSRVMEFINARKEIEDPLQHSSLWHINRKS